MSNPHSTAQRRTTRRARRLLLPACILAALVTVPVAQAASVPATAHTKTGQKKDTSQGSIALQQVFVTANDLSALPVPMKSAFTATHITAEDIKFAPPSINAQTLLRSKPSISATSAGPNGVRTTITLRAFNSGQFAETFDGVPINDAFNGGATNQASNRNAIPLTLNDIGRVDIYRGINNPSVNSYNSLGGTINYVPRTPSASPDASVMVGGGSFGSLTVGASADTGDIGGVRNLLSITHNKSDGWVDHTHDRNTNLYYAADAPYDQDRARLYAYVLYNRNRGNTPHSIPVPLIRKYGYRYGWPLDWTYSKNRNHNVTVIIGNRVALSDALAFDAKFYYHNNNYRRVSYTNPAYVQSATQPYYLPNTPGDYAFWLYNATGPTYDPAATFGSKRAGNAYHLYMYASNKIGFQPRLDVHLPDNHIQLGADVSQSTLHSSEWWYGSRPVPHRSGYNDAWNEHDRRNLLSAYVQDSIHLMGDMLTITPGVKYLRAHTVDNDDIGFFYAIGGSVSDTEHYTAPTLGVNLRPIPDLSLYASYGKNIKFPGISSYYNNVGQQDANGNYVVVPVNIKPEYVKDLEGGVRYTHAGLSAQLDAYREDFTHTFINATDPNTGLSYTTNGGSSRYKGIELEASQSLDSRFGHWKIFGNWSENKANFTSSFSSTYAGDVTRGQPLANVPKHLANLGVTWTWNGYRAQVSDHYVGPQYLNQFDAGVPGAARIGGYSVMDIGLSDTLAVDSGNDSSLQLSLNLVNALDHRYYQRAFTDTTYDGTAFKRVLVGEPRAIYGSVRYTF